MIFRGNLHVAQEIKNLSACERGEKILVAVSGGIDSVVLLDTLCVSKPLHGAEIGIIHVNHGIRSKIETDKDEELIESLAKKYNISYIIERFNLGKDASEMDARNARYSAFEKYPNKVFLAHHLDDQIETVLIGLLRGNNPKAIAGMEKIRDNKYVRLFLDISKEHIFNWAGYRNLTWNEDITNASDDYLRNKIRHNLIPEIAKIAPGYRKTISSIANNVREIIK